MHYLSLSLSPSLSLTVGHSANVQNPIVCSCPSLHPVFVCVVSGFSCHMLSVIITITLCYRPLVACCSLGLAHLVKTKMALTNTVKRCRPWWKFYVYCFTFHIMVTHPPPPPPPSAAAIALSGGNSESVRHSQQAIALLCWLERTLSFDTFGFFYSWTLCNYFPAFILYPSCVFIFHLDSLN